MSESNSNLNSYYQDLDAYSHSELYNSVTENVDGNEVLTGLTEKQIRNNYDRDHLEKVILKNLPEILGDTPAYITERRSIERASPAEKITKKRLQFQIEIREARSQIILIESKIKEILEFEKSKKFSLAKLRDYPRFVFEDRETNDVRWKGKRAGDENKFDRALQPILDIIGLEDVRPHQGQSIKKLSKQIRKLNNLIYINNEEIAVIEKRVSK